MSERSVCEWWEDSDGVWWTGCDESFVVNEGGPAYNGFRYCPYCGRPLEERPYQEEEPLEEA